MDNDGYIAFDLLDSGGKIMCNTNYSNCCNSGSDGQGSTVRPPLGNWYFPDGSTVSSRNEIGDATPSFVRNRGDKVVRLFRVATMSSPPQRGRFHCVVPNNQSINQTYYVNICKLLIAIRLLPTCLATLSNFNFSGHW